MLRQKRGRGMSVLLFPQQTCTEHLLCALCPQWPVPVSEPEAGGLGLSWAVEAGGLGLFSLGPAARVAPGGHLLAGKEDGHLRFSHKQDRHNLPAVEPAVSLGEHTRKWNTW